MAQLALHDLQWTTDIVQQATDHSRSPVSFHVAAPAAFLLPCRRRVFLGHPPDARRNARAAARALPAVGSRRPLRKADYYGMRPATNFGCLSGIASPHAPHLKVASSTQAPAVPPRLCGRPANFVRRAHENGSVPVGTLWRRQLAAGTWQLATVSADLVLSRIARDIHRVGAPAVDHCPQPGVRVDVQVHLRSFLPRRPFEALDVTGFVTAGQVLHQGPPHLVLVILQERHARAAAGSPPGLARGRRTIPGCPGRCTRASSAS